jgi:hypothetical protein
MLPERLMSRVRFRIWMIMLAIAAVAVLMIPLRLMGANPQRLFAAVVLAIAIGLFLILCFAPIVGLVVAIRAATFRSFRKRATHIARHPDRSLSPDRVGQAEKV